jgi:putative transposase
VSGLKLAKTRMAKSVLDSGWGILKAQLQYKGQWAGRSVKIVNDHTPAVSVRPAGPGADPQASTGYV